MESDVMREPCGRHGQEALSSQKAECREQYIPWLNDLVVLRHTVVGRGFESLYICILTISFWSQQSNSQAILILIVPK